LEHAKVFKLVYVFLVMLKIKKLTDVIGKKVYTDTGDYFGEVEESNLVENKVESWRIKVVSSMGSFLGGARGVIIPHQFVRAIGDVVIVSRASLPLDESNTEVQETVDLSEEDSYEGHHVEGPVM
jgi:sporulation protein YlmC with PRC-barrel domain